MTSQPSRAARVLGRRAISCVAFAVIAASFGCTGSDNSPAAPQLTVVYDLGPISGPMEGGTAVTVYLHALPGLAEGAGFQPGMIVKFGGAPATNVTVLNDTLIGAIAPSWFMAYDSALAQGKLSESKGVLPHSLNTFAVTVSAAGKKTNLDVSVGYYTYVDTTFRCDSDCYDYQRARSKPLRTGTLR
jgi:hypothetical protein